MAAKTPNPTFIVRLLGPELEPAKVPFRAVNAALSAVQDLASGRDPLETRQVPDGQVIGLVKVRCGSAVYSCVSRAPEDARQNLSLVGKLLSSDVDSMEPGEGLARTLKPIEKLSEVARNIGCTVEVALANRPNNPLFSIEKDDFEKLSKRLFLAGKTTVIGTVKRAGGQTDMKCMLSVPGRKHQLYCSVKSKKVVQRLGRHLYEEIAATGDVVWIHSTWHIYKFTIHDFTQPRLGDTNKAIEGLRKAGLSAWDKVRDPDTFIRELRS